MMTSQHMGQTFEGGNFGWSLLQAFQIGLVLYLHATGARNQWVHLQP